MRESLRRSIALATAALFIISLAFPAVAAFVKDTKAWPKWWGVLDVTLAFVLVVLVLVVLTTARDRVNKEVEQITYKVYRVLIWAIFLLMAVFVVAGDRIIWTQCLTGFAWRYWLLLYALPWWIGASRITSEKSTSC
jgi:hypothetical protein